jgi:hypothetical protein
MANLLKIWWPGRELNPRRQLFQSYAMLCLNNFVQRSIRTNCFGDLSQRRGGALLVSRSTAINPNFGP